MKEKIFLKVAAKNAARQHFKLRPKIGFIK
jgi:hypothetical protein